jgi:hypothetical protein
MRVCPICNEYEKKEIQRDYTHTSIINNGIEAGLSLYECPTCGFRYLDSENVDQAWFDWYYANVYKTDDKPYSDGRLDSLADFIASHNYINALDIGGMDGELQARLHARGVHCDVSGVGDFTDKVYNAVILSHTLEHIYDIDAMFTRVIWSLNNGGMLVVEIPIHLDYNNPDYDKHWQHINKFRPQDIERAFKTSALKIITSEQLPDYREYKVWRIAGIYEPF